jgi:hypothetical protein
MVAPHGGFSLHTPLMWVTYLVPPAIASFPIAHSKRQFFSLSITFQEQEFLNRNEKAPGRPSLTWPPPVHGRVTPCAWLIPQGTISLCYHPLLKTHWWELDTSSLGCFSPSPHQPTRSSCQFSRSSVTGSEQGEVRHLPCLSILHRSCFLQRWSFTTPSISSNLFYGLDYSKRPKVSDPYLENIPLHQPLALIIGICCVGASPGSLLTSCYTLSKCGRKNHT